MEAPQSVDTKNRHTLKLDVLAQEDRGSFIQSGKTLYPRSLYKLKWQASYPDHETIVGPPEIKTSINRELNADGVWINTVTVEVDPAPTAEPQTRLQANLNPKDPWKPSDGLPIEYQYHNIGRIYEEFPRTFRLYEPSRVSPLPATLPSLVGENPPEIHLHESAHNNN